MTDKPITDVRGYLETQGLEAGGACLIARSSKDVLHATVDECVRDLTADPGTYAAACRELNLERGEAESDEVFQARFRDEVSKRVRTHALGEVNRVKEANADNPDKIAFEGRGYPRPRF